MKILGSTIMKPLCIYHNLCQDGFTSAWIVNKYFSGEVEFYAATHGEPPPNVTGRDVIMVGVSYKKLVLEDMAAEADSILILDHHKSAQEELRHLLVPSVANYPQACATFKEMKDFIVAPVIALFDMERSGAGMTWDFFFPNDPRPAFINHVEDRDLLRFALAGTREIASAIFSREYRFDLWDALEIRPLDDLHAEGDAIERKQHKDVQELVSALKRPMEIAGYLVPCCSLPYTLTSDAGHLMCEQDWYSHGAPEFAACYWDDKSYRTFSLRSSGDFDVSEIAQKYGGGGHKNAAGFRVSRDHYLAQV